MQLLRTFLMLVAGILSAFPVNVAQAQEGIVTCTGLDCNLCSFGVMLNNGINWLFGFMAVAAVIVLAVAGFKLVTSGGNTEARDWAKARIGYVILGFLLMLSSWLIVDTILRGLTGSDKGMQVWGSFDIDNCGGMTAANNNPKNSGNTAVEGSFETAMDELIGDPGALGVGPVGDRSDVPVAADGISATQAKALLAQAGIEVKNDQVGLQGLQPHVINRIKELDAACNCNLLITEGTAGKHAAGTYSHANGYKLDIRTNDNPTLVNYIKNNYTLGGTWKDGTPYYVSGKNTCAIESTHLDCQFKP